MKKIILTLFLLLSIIFAGHAVAHQPRLVEEGQITEVKNYDISQAFYGELKGKPAFYQISTPDPFKLYIGILSPDIPGAHKDFRVTVTADHKDEVGIAHEDQPVLVLDGANFKWTQFYEPFAGDSYWKGPDKKMDLEAGTYKIEVSNPENKGKYSLVIGEKESFPPLEMIKTIITLPSLKKDFFGKSPFTAYFNYTGLFLLLVLIILIAIIWLIAWLVRRHNKKKGRLRSLKP